MENVYKAESSTSLAPPVSNYNSLSNENCRVAHDIVDIHAQEEHEEDEDALAEADKLLDQLDLLSSD